MSGDTSGPIVSYLSRISNSGIMHQDGQNSVTMITDTEGKKVDSFTYSSYGTPDHTNPVNPYYFTGRRYDDESGLYYYRFRYYHPTLGRFLEQDPIGILDNINLYSYVNNNPVNWIDPLGLEKEPGGELPPNKEEPWWPDWVEDILPEYGNYGGPGKTDPNFERPPKDSLDNLFKEHDKYWSQGKGDLGDKIIDKRFENLPKNPKDWKLPPSNSQKASNYRRDAEIYFKIRSKYLELVGR